MPMAWPSCSLVAKASAPISLRSAPAMNWPGLPLRKSRPFRSERSLSLARSPPSSIRTACPRVFTFLSGRSIVSRPTPSPRSSKWKALDIWGRLRVCRTIEWMMIDGGWATIGTIAHQPSRISHESRRVRHQDRIGLDARDGFESALGHGLAQLCDRPEIGVGRPSTGELPAEVLAEDVGRVLDQPGGLPAG